MRTRRLTILNVAYPMASVSSDAVGGAEQVLAQLDAALVRAGHRSIVVAREGSAVFGKLISTPAWDGALDGQAKRAAEVHTEAIRRAQALWPIDIIHLHGIDFTHYLQACAITTLVTLHLPIEWYPANVLRSPPPHVFYNCVSASQHGGCPPCAQLLPCIRNGVAVGHFRARHAKRNFALCLGRICPEKGFHIALNSVKAAGIGLLIAGKVYGYPAHEAYFKNEILPRLDDKRLFIGPADFSRKRRLLTAARCLLVPSLAAETSSLVAMEALACGTPVVTFPSGALSEIVQHGETGFLVSNQKEMADAIHECRTIDPERCRESAWRRFNTRRTVASYLELYSSLAANTATSSQIRSDLRTVGQGILGTEIAEKAN